MGVEPELFVSDAVESVESRAVTAVSVGDSEAVTHSLSCDHVPDKITDLTASPLPAISDEASAAAMGATTAALASAAAFGFGGPAGLAASESVNDSAVKLINSVNSENVGSDLVADVVSSLEVPTVPASTVVNEEKKLDLADECVDGLYASRTGVWRPYQLLSATGLVTPAEEGWCLVKFKSGKESRVKRDLCVGYELDLVGKKIDGGIWERMRPGEEVKRAKRKAAEEVQQEVMVEESAREKDEAVRQLPVKWAMVVSLGLLEEELSEAMLAERVRDKRKWDFWYGEYLRRVKEAGSEREFIDWMVFSQNMLRKSGKRWEEQWVWEARERRLMAQSSVRQQRAEKVCEQKEARRANWRLEVKCGDGLWMRVDNVSWGCVSRVSRGLAAQLGVPEGAASVQLKVRAVEHGVGQSELQLWVFEVVEGDAEWIEVRGKGLEVQQQPVGVPAKVLSQIETTTRDTRGDGRLVSGSGKRGAAAVGRPQDKKARLGVGSEEVMGAIWLQCPVSGQWVKCEGVRKGPVATISRFMVGQLGGNVVKGRVLLQVRDCEGVGSVPVWFEVVDEAEPDVVWPGRAVWRRVHARLPSTQDEQHMRWEGEVEWLKKGLGSEEGYWREKEKEAEARANEAGELGGFHEVKGAQPNSEVLGPWVQLSELEDGHAFDYTRESDAPEWLRERKSVFVAGGMIVKPGMYEKWKAAGADEEILGWIKQGGYEVWVSEDGGRGIFKRNGKIAQENGTALAVLVCELLLKETWELVSEEELRKSGNILPLNLAPKPSKDPPWRIICNAIDLNVFVSKWKCRYESLKSLGCMISQKGDSWLFSIDLEDAYYSCMLTKNCRGLFGAKVRMHAEQLAKLREAGLVPDWLVIEEGSERDVCIQPRGLPMGFTNSCAIWTKIARVLTRKWRERGWSVCGYIDDFLFVASSEEEAWRMLRQALSDIEELGLAPSYRKTIVPTKRLKFLGVLVDSALCRFFIPGEKIEILKELARAVRERDVASMRELASVAGKVISMSVAIPAARLLTRACYQLVRPDKQEGYDKEVVVSEEVRWEMNMLLKWIDVWNRKGAPIHRRIQMQEVRVMADAGSGWGYRLDGEVRSLELSAEVVAHAGEWSDEERDMFQPWKELLVVEKMLELEGGRLKGASLLFLSDATAAVSYMNKGSGPSEVMSGMMKRIFTMCVENEISLMADHVSGELMKVSGVDSLSRWGEFSVAKQVFKCFNASCRWGRYGGSAGYDVDLYASHKAAQCAKYCARRAEEGAVGDARTYVCDESENHWVCPPLPLIEKAVQQFWEQGVLGTVVVPDWENAIWHLFLRERAVHSVALPWKRESPTMVDVASKKVERHGVDRWSFRAFLVDNRGKGAVVGKLLPSKQRLVLSEGEVERKVQGVWLRNVRVLRYLRVVDLFAGMGSVPFLLEKLGVRAHVMEVEWDAKARAVAEVNAPGVVHGEPHDVWYWASEEGLERLVAMRPELLVAGFPCQSVSVSAPKGKGLKGKSGAFEALNTIIRRLREVGVLFDFVVECTDFSHRHKQDFRYVTDQLGVEPVVLCASDLAACYRRRAYWTTFQVEPIEKVEVDPNSVLEPGRVSLWEKLPTLVASGVSSWNTREVVEENGKKGPLLVSEMERAMQFDVGFTEVEGLSLKDRHRLVGNAFHAGVLRHVLLNYISAKCMSHVVTRDDPDGQGKPFVENQDGPWGSFTFKSESRRVQQGLGLQGEAAQQQGGSSWSQLGCLETQREVELGQQRAALMLQHSRWGKKEEKAKDCQRGSSESWGRLVFRSEQGGAPPKRARRGPEGSGVLGLKPRARVLGDLGAKSQTALAKPELSEVVKVEVKVEQSVADGKRSKGQVAAWRSLLEGSSEVMGEVSSMEGLMQEREAGKGFELRTLSWRRERKKVQLEGDSLFEGARALADDYAVKSKSEATWKSYMGWWEVLEAFGRRFGLEDLEGAEQRHRVELVRIAAALLSLAYAWGTINIFVTACSAKFKLKGWDSFWGVETFKATYNGIKRELGVKAEKKPPVEPWHVQEILALDCPGGWSELQWEQAQTLLLLGFELFNRRQDFGRLQPCDLREVDGVEDKRVWELLIRYAKNDVQGLTRAPRIIQAEDERCCLGRRLESYMKVMGIKVSPHCNKVWGKPYPCDFCEPLFPAVWRQGKKAHAMPDSRVGRVVKGMFKELAKAKPELLTAEDAEKFSTRSMRSGGVSSAAAECVRDGVLQGHGGWLARESLRHYDQMKEKEKTVVGDALGKAISKCWGEKEVRGEGGVRGQRMRERVRGMQPVVEDSDSDEGGESSDGEAIGNERLYEVSEVKGARWKKGQQFLVAWKGFPDETWEFEVDLLEEGAAEAVAEYLRGHTRKGQVRKGLSGM